LFAVLLFSSFYLSDLPHLVVLKATDKISGTTVSLKYLFWKKEFEFPSEPSSNTQCVTYLQRATFFSSILENIFSITVA
jgi:hypothetical protein